MRRFFDPGITKRGKHTHIDTLDRFETLCCVPVLYSIHLRFSVECEDKANPGNSCVFTQGGITLFADGDVSEARDNILGIIRASMMEGTLASAHSSIVSLRYVEVLAEAPGDIDNNLRRIPIERVSSRPAMDWVLAAGVGFLSIIGAIIGWKRLKNKGEDEEEVADEVHIDGLSYVDDTDRDLIGSEVNVSTASYSDGDGLVASEFAGVYPPLFSGASSYAPSGTESEVSSSDSFDLSRLSLDQSSPTYAVPPKKLLLSPDRSETDEFDFDLAKQWDVAEEKVGAKDIVDPISGRSPEKRADGTGAAPASMKSVESLMSTATAMAVSAIPSDEVENMQKDPRIESVEQKPQSWVSSSNDGDAAEYYPSPSGAAPDATVMATRGVSEGAESTSGDGTVRPCQSLDATTTETDGISEGATVRSFDPFDDSTEWKRDERTNPDNAWLPSREDGKTIGVSTAQRQADAALSIMSSAEKERAEMTEEEWEGIVLGEAAGDERGEGEQQFRVSPLSINLSAEEALASSQSSEWPLSSPENSLTLVRTEETEVPQGSLLHSEDGGSWEGMLPGSFSDEDQNLSLTNAWGTAGAFPMQPSSR